MKVILSRKGFDSGAGGYASFIFPNGILQSLPIPDHNASITYSKVLSRYEQSNLMDLMIKHRPYIKDKSRIVLNENTSCHLDPDIDVAALPRLSGWRGCFGQLGAAQTVLQRYKVGQDDIFLFFGWFQDYSQIQDGRSNSGKHVIFGYLQIDDVIYPQKDTIPPWLMYHPHATGSRLMVENNCIYIARERSSWNKKLPGFGVFHYSKRLQLTKDGMSRSKWALPEAFRGLTISYHSTDSWKEGYFQSAHRGQEFVFQENDMVSEWAIELIEEHVDIH